MRGHMQAYVNKIYILYSFLNSSQFSFCLTILNQSISRIHHHSSLAKHLIIRQVH